MIRATLYTRRNYLRVRGEYGLEELPEHHLAELPPRARRIRNRRVASVTMLGTTSACAENTP